MTVLTVAVKEASNEGLDVAVIKKDEKITKKNVFSLKNWFSKTKNEKKIDLHLFFLVEKFMKFLHKNFFFKHAKQKIPANVFACTCVQARVRVSV